MCVIGILSLCSVWVSFVLCFSSVLIFSNFPVSVSFLGYTLMTLSQLFLISLIDLSVYLSLVFLLFIVISSLCNGCSVHILCNSCVPKKYCFEFAFH